MAGNPFYQDLDPAGAPEPVTPADSPSDPAGFAMVTPHGRGPAGYDIQAPQADLGAVVAGATALTGPGGPRQAATEHLLSSPQGYGEQDITSGFSGGGGEDWPGNVSPG